MVGKGKNSSTHPYTYRDMKTENKDKKDLKVVVKMLNRSWDQVCNSLPDDFEETTAEQIHAYTIAMQVIDKIEEQIQHYLITGEQKEIEILFDKDGSMYI